MSGSRQPVSHRPQGVVSAAGQEGLFLPFSEMHARGWLHTPALALCCSSSLQPDGDLQKH